MTDHEERYTLMEQCNVISGRVRYEIRDNLQPGRVVDYDRDWARAVAKLRRYNEEARIFAAATRGAGSAS